MKAEKNPTSLPNQPKANDIFDLTVEPIEDTIFVYRFARFSDGSVYMNVDCPSVSEGFPSTDPSINAEYIRSHWDKVAVLQ